jgi:hypothetical protein
MVVQQQKKGKEKEQQHALRMLCSLAERLPVVHMHLQHLLLVCLAGAKEKQKKAAISSIRVGSHRRSHQAS